jgi:hypothetical protein
MEMEMKPAISLVQFTPSEEVSLKDQMTLIPMNTFSDLLSMSQSYVDHFYGTVRFSAGTTARRPVDIFTIIAPGSPIHRSWVQLSPRTAIHAHRLTAPGTG